MCEGRNTGRRSLVGWKDKVKEYMQGGSECKGSDGGSSSVAISLWDVPRGNKLSQKTIDC